MAELETINSSGELEEIKLGGTADGDKVLTSDEVDAKDVTNLATANSYTDTELESYVPYTGATGDVNIGVNKFTAGKALITVKYTASVPVPSTGIGIAIYHTETKAAIESYNNDGARKPLAIVAAGMEIFYSDIYPNGSDQDIGKSTDKWRDGYFSRYIDVDTQANLNGAIKVNITTVNAATYDLLTTDYILNVTYTATGTCTITLPTAQVVSGRTITIKDAGGNAGTNNITVATEGAETIDGVATAILNSNYNAINLYSDGSNWFIY